MSVPRVTFYSDADEGFILVADAIQHEGHWWFVTAWLRDRASQHTFPERLVRPVEGLEDSGGDPRFVVKRAVPKTVLDGTPSPGWMVVDGLALARSQPSGRSH